MTVINILDVYERSQNLQIGDKVKDIFEDSPSPIYTIIDEDEDSYKIDNNANYNFSKTLGLLMLEDDYNAIQENGFLIPKNVDLTHLQLTYIQTIIPLIWNIV